MLSVAAAQSHVKIADATYQHIEAYDKQWRNQVRGRWKPNLIKSVLLDTAVRIAKKKGVEIVTPEHAQDAIMGWHTTGEIDKCFHAGINIMKRQKKERYKFMLGHTAKKFAHVKSIGS